MLKEFFTAALGMMNQQSRLEVTANNMANANSAGFKREGIFERNLIDARANFYNTRGDVEQNDPPVGSYTDWKDGAMRQTDNPLDLALEGDGFFVLSDEFGRQYLSKAGHFTMTKEGNLVTMDGKQLIGSNGPINIINEYFGGRQNQDDSQALDIKVSLQGEIFANNINVGNITVAEIKNPESLNRLSSTDFTVSEQTQIEYKELEEIRVRQGWLEMSNVNIVNEMVEMIELQRMFETGGRVITVNDTTLDNSIQMGRYF